MFTKRLAFFAAILTSTMVSASTPIEMKILYNKERPFHASVVMIEKQPGQLKALVDTLTEQKSLRLEIENTQKSVSMICETSKISTSCRFKVTAQFPDVVVSPGEGLFVKQLALNNFRGLEVLSKNPNLEIPFEVKTADEFFTLNLGAGKMNAGGGAIQP